MDSKGTNQISSITGTSQWPEQLSKMKQVIAKSKYFLRKFKIYLLLGYLLWLYFRILPNTHECFVCQMKLTNNTGYCDQFLLVGITVLAQIWPVVVDIIWPKSNGIYDRIKGNS